ncbi:ankyrin repeat domain-containing protein [Allorhodopirellula solitaria]|uniref:Phosphocholine transferase AnkX n=1 Tax=Allorhodopirellula solitaria TaxID=2527987 RepID=A0A5C5YCP3_9BACT|nr:ankyrin repeat domain-containing protein [Allorhodopirellula solitaria]TWT72864.1 Phosphocholine transferase AnkX [Allorhodopirellula solitaria]
MESPNTQSYVEHSHLIYASDEVSGEDVGAENQAAAVDVPGAALHSAAASDDIETIERLVAEGTDVNAIPRGFTVTALAMAASYGTPETIHTLVRLGADLQAQGSEGVSPLLFAVQSGNASNLSTLLELGADPHQVDAITGSLLHHAAIVQSSEALSVLLTHGVDPAIENEEGNTPLEYITTRRSAIEQALAGMNSQDAALLSECLQSFLKMEQVLQSREVSDD